uniref:Conserved conjugative plasmid protein n=1 Tax=Saccharolobus solfataricus (strain ATCC 35092 / DSM 1617 / JCM 11322 / P2) TaxID=273057 RepID=S6DM05_SACS2|nr:hypothetical protein [Saccharolobus solfataricus]CDF66442.1 conserved conjugative plasmid protein [Saccharolobus solfataricus P2]
MSTLQVSGKVNSPVEGENKLVFSLDLIVESLNRENRRILAEEFAGDLESLGYTEQYVSMLLNGKRILGNDALKRLLVNSPEALDRAIELLKLQIKQLEEAARILQTSDLSLLKKEYGPKIKEEEDEEEEAEEE